MERWFVRAQLSVVRLRERLVDDRGATAVEYCIMVAFIACVIVVGVTILGNATNSGFSKVKFP
jgi:Flp pilus assembly pilin Flp